MTGYMNDPPDESMENCMWYEKHGRLHVTVLPGCQVRQNEEFFISYGNQHWCSTKFDLVGPQIDVFTHRKIF